MIVQDQLELAFDTVQIEDPNYLSRQLITYLGNKRTLVPDIRSAIHKVLSRLQKDRLHVYDAFSGSGVISRLLKAYSSVIFTNDIEDYAATISRCYLTNKSAVHMPLVADVIAYLNGTVDADGLFEPGFIEKTYSARDESNVQGSDRLFYSKANARRLDNYRRLIQDCDPELRDLLLGPLLSKASVHANTSGVFKGFYKDRETGIGRFGGTNRDALNRILAPIVLEPPILSRAECDFEVLQADANSVARNLKGLDLAYIDPPYNQHPYGSNYFMLNLIVNYEAPHDISRVSGIPANWRRSLYNVRSRASSQLADLVENLDAKFILISYNNEGFISPDAMRSILTHHGKCETLTIKYNTFRGSRNLRNRDIHVREHLYLLERA